MADTPLTVGELRQMLAQYPDDMQLGERDGGGFFRAGLALEPRRLRRFKDEPETAVLESEGMWDRNAAAFDKTFDALVHF